jgi:electron transfer flavoprotein alpha subunit
MEEKRVLIVGELAEGKIASITAELLTVGRALANQVNGILSAVFIGNQISEEVANEAISLHSDKVYIIDDPLFKDYLTDTYVAALESLERAIMPEILLLGHTTLGRDLAPRLSFRLRTGLTTDCVELSLDPKTKRLRKTKSVYGGNAWAVYVCEEGRPQMATLRAKVIQPSKQDTSRKGEVIHFDPKVDEAVASVRIIDRVREELPGIKLEDADIVVCGGRGIGGPEGFKQLEELARILNGAIGCTRIPSDNKWVSASCQIGLTGKIISPSLYFGIALSGASQHLAGISGNTPIVAINKDPNANVFSRARYGIVNEYQKVLPSLIEKCRQLCST